MFKRVLLKISGEGFCSDGGYGVDKREIEHLARSIKAVVDLGVEVAVVIGAGNIVRGKQLRALGVSRARSDNIGMVATLINALVLQDELENDGIVAKVLSTFFVHQVVEAYILANCMEHLSNGRVVILAGGTGYPYFTTDTAAALRAAEIEADCLLKATKVDGVYSEDPVLNSDAERFERLTYMDVLNKELGVMDATAITLCMDNNIPIIVFDMKDTGNFRDVVNRISVGTYIGRVDDAD